MTSARTFGVCLIFLTALAMAQTPIPTIEQPLVPAAAQPGGAGFTLTINGAGFINPPNPPPTAVLWGQGSSVIQLAVTSSTATQLTATVPAANIGTAGTPFVSVLSSSGLTSNVEFFQIATPASPQFAAPVDYSPGLNTVETALVADFNGDGILDLAIGVGAVAANIQEVAVLLGNGDGTFQSPTAYSVTDASSIVAGRFTNDGGSIDLVAGETLLVNNGAGVFTPSSLGVPGFRPFAVGDFRQIGVLDIAGLIGPNIQVLNNNGISTFTPGQNFPGGTTVAGMLTADFNGDGILDLAVLDTGGPAVRVFLGLSGGGFNTASPLTTGTPPGGIAFTAADFNGDSKQDIALVSQSTGGQVSILNGNGDGSFTSGFSQLLANPVTGGIVTGDFNEDGKLDLATGTYILPGNGNGTFQTPINFGGTAEVLATGDFNGDGRPDLVAQSSPNVAILLQQGVLVSPTTLNFSAQTVGTSSASQQITLSNIQNAVLTINSISITGPNANEFSQTNGCGASLAANSSCSIKITFTPTAAGTATAFVSVADNAASSPQTVSLAGVGQTAGPGATLNPSPVNFTPTQPQLVGTSASVPVSLSNTGNAALTIASIAFTGPNAAEFAQTNNCPTSLGVQASCTINVTFTPTAGGSPTATASLSVTDNAPTSPQTVPLTGAVQNFSLTTTCTSLNVVPGQTAIFTVDLAPVNGFTKSVALSCSGAPALATCTVTPTSMTLDGSTTVQARVTATTTRAFGFLRLPFGHSDASRMAGLVGLAGITGFAALVIMPGKRQVKPGRRLRGLIVLLGLLSTTAMLPSCGGGATDPPGTAAGTFPLTVTGTFQSATGTAVTEKVSFNLVVQ